MPENNSIYSKLGVSSKKEDIHRAIDKMDKGLFPGAFCKVIEDIFNREEYCSIFHSDGAGTKSSLAYMYYRETNDISVFKDIVQDAIVMNVDDILCVGATGPYYLANTIGRNSRFITGDIIGIIIGSYYSFCSKLSKLGLKVIMGGGETADVGDIVRTLLIDASIFTTMKKKDIIDASNIKVGDVIVGLSSFGQTSYEDKENSGIGSNGLTLARHGVLANQYYKKYPECFDPNLDPNFTFFGKYNLTDKLKGMNLTIGKALLSPTRTYAPLLIEMFKKYRNRINGIIHNTGGGQTKVLNFGKGIKYIKNNLFKIPKVFEIIQNSSEIPWREMFQVFNMGHRMELYCSESIAKDIITIAQNFNIESRVIGYCEKSSNSERNELEINSEFGSFTYN